MTEKLRSVVALSLALMSIGLILTLLSVQVASSYGGPPF